MKDNGLLYAWSIYDNLHVLDLNNYQWEMKAKAEKASIAGDF